MKIGLNMKTIDNSDGSVFSGSLSKNFGIYSNEGKYSKIEQVKEWKAFFFHHLQFYMEFCFVMFNSIE